MKRIINIGLILALTMTSLAYAAGDRGGEGGGEHGSGSGAPERQSPPAQAARSAPARVSRQAQNRPAQVHQPVVIRMNRSTVRPAAQQPSYGHVQWNRSTTRSAVPAARVQATRQLGSKPVAGIRSANVVHHRAYQQGVVRQKLSKIGVKSEPSHITDRSEMVFADKTHSTINYPQRGPKGEAIRGSVVNPRQFNNAGVRAQMSLVMRPSFSAEINGRNASETQRGSTYWHNGNGFNYAHYIDNGGSNWYGFYNGNQYFWTRNYAGRWWWYDSGYNRWCFYNDNYWWWQDPYHVGDLYAYDNADYIPANSADDQIVVSGDEQANDTVYSSPDGTRRVKLVQGDGDAFLYDGAAVPTFDPIYLASGVQSVQYSDVNNGRPLEIVLKLNDGSYDLFGADGQVYNAEASN